MKIALFLKNETLKVLHADAFSVLVIQMSNQSIESVENHSLFSKDPDYISLWLIRRQIDTIYIQNADQDIKDYFRRINVEVNSFRDLKDDPVLNLFLL
ncbi:MAG TPA: hypothetical protein DIT04_05835 [Dysgonomonas sp.]|nr:hypothetical protein [Dysgonomonas sp.]